jgi:hypothetical protein
MTQLQPTVTDGFVDEELLRLCDELDDIALMQRNIWAERDADQQLDPEEREHPTQQRIRRLDEGALRLKENRRTPSGVACLSHLQAPGAARPRA